MSEIFGFSGEFQSFQGRFKKTLVVENSNRIGAVVKVRVVAVEVIKVEIKAAAAAIIIVVVLIPVVVALVVALLIVIY